MAEKQDGRVEGSGVIDVNNEAGPTAVKEQVVGGMELSQTEDGLNDTVQTNEALANAGSNDGGDCQKEPEKEANPKDDIPVPRSPRPPTPVPSSPPASPTNSRAISQAPGSPRMNEVDSISASINLQDDINIENPSDQLIMQEGGSNAAESKTVKRPRPRPLRKQAAIEDGLVTTRGKRARSGPAPKEILTLAE